MKIIEDEEKQAHRTHIINEGAKGFVIGSFISAGAFLYLRSRHASAFARYNTSIKTCIFTMPSVTMCAFYADQGSWEFDRKVHASSYSEQKVLAEYREWNRMTLGQKALLAVSNNKYPIILGAWAASMYGSWVYVNRDKIMTTSQKAVQARMYAQAITILLLLSTIILASKEQEINKDKPKPIPEWKAILMQKEENERLKQQRDVKLVKQEHP